MKKNTPTSTDPLGNSTTTGPWRLGLTTAAPPADANDREEELLLINNISHSNQSRTTNYSSSHINPCFRTPPPDAASSSTVPSPADMDGIEPLGSYFAELNSMDQYISFNSNNQSYNESQDHSISPPYVEPHPHKTVHYPFNDINLYDPFLPTVDPLSYAEPPPHPVHYPTNNMSQYNICFPSLQSPAMAYDMTQGSSSVSHGMEPVDNSCGDLSCLPPGYIFSPKDDELILDFLMKKLSNQSLPSNVIIDIDLYKCNPWDLEGTFNQSEAKQILYFFTPTYRKYPKGKRPSRAAGDGYWKATGADQKIKNNRRKPFNDKVYGDIAYGDIIGTKRALVFYRGKPPKGDKTNWIMHEYNLDPKYHCPNQKGSAGDIILDTWVLCELHKKKSLKRSSIDDDGENEPMESNFSRNNDHVEEHIA
ncbi:hypothetical protein ACOSQ3_020751 [Xanthoceras sorbifolium]